MPAKREGVLYASSTNREWQERAVASEKAAHVRQSAELRRKLGTPETGTAAASKAMRTRTAAQKAAAFYDASGFRENYGHLAAETASREDAARRRQEPAKTFTAERKTADFFDHGGLDAKKAAALHPERARKAGILYDEHTREQVPDSVALPQKNGHSEDPRQWKSSPSNFTRVKRDREGRPESVGGGENHSGHSERPLEERLYRGGRFNERDDDRGFFSVGAEQHNGHSKDRLADRLCRRGGKAPRSKHPDAWDHLYELSRKGRSAR
ncbi:MAG: hypothetical protein ACLPWS_04135 [Rhodomicrobium sp.]